MRNPIDDGLGRSFIDDGDGGNCIGPTAGFDSVRSANIFFFDCSKVHTDTSKCKIKTSVHNYNNCNKKIIRYDR